MIEILLIIYIFFLIFTKIFPPNLEYLNCGIFAWTGKYPSLFNLDKFNTIGLYNDSRGGDSAGIFYNGRLLRGIGKYSKYENFIKNVERFNPEFNVVIGHTRKASVGSTSLANAQPIYITDESGECVDFILSHNGTIYNHEELAKKYDVDTSELFTDTQVLARLIQKVGVKILEEYHGTAALLFWDRKSKNSISIFRGESSYSLNSNYTSEERPLYMFKDLKSMYFSSLKDPLEVLAGKTKDKSDIISEVPANTVIELHKGKIVDEIKINRDKSSQSKISTNNNFNNRRTREPVDIYTEDALVRSNNTTSRQNNRVDNFNNNNHNDYFLELEKNGGVSINNEKTMFEDSIDKLNFKQCRYWINYKLANGIYHLSKTGYHYPNNPGIAKTMRFIEGLYIPHHKDFDYIKKNYPTASFSEDISYYRAVLKASGFPAQRSILDTALPMYQTVRIYNKAIDAVIPFTGKYQPLFTDRIYTFNAGSLEGVSFSNETKILDSTSLNILDLEDYITVEENMENDYSNNVTTEEDMELENLKGIRSSVDSFLEGKLSELATLESDAAAEFISKISDFKKELETVAPF